MNKMKHQAALRAAFPYMVPIMTGFLFLGLTYGLFARQLGFSTWYPFFMSFVIFAGSAEFLVTTLLTQPFNPLSTFFSDINGERAPFILWPDDAGSF